MKTKIFVAIISFLVGSAFAQTYNMKIKQGEDAAYARTSTIDEITFLDETTDPFVCGDVILYGGETYPTVLIGSQCWMQKNLNIGTRIDATIDQTDNPIIEKYCYEDLDATCTTYGGLYYWSEAMQYIIVEGTQGICPDGWHIPTLTDFQTLAATVNDNSNELKAVGEGYDLGLGTNSSGFSALFAGIYIQVEGMFFAVTEETAYYSSSVTTPSAPYIVDIQNSNSDIGFFSFGLSIEGEVGISIRCIKD